MDFKFRFVLIDENGVEDVSMLYCNLEREKYGEKSLKSKCLTRTLKKSRTTWTFNLLYKL